MAAAKNAYGLEIVFMNIDTHAVMRSEYVVSSSGQRALWAASVEEKIIIPGSTSGYDYFKGRSTYRSKCL